MQKWKVASRVKIDDSKIEEPVRGFLNHPDENIRQKTQALLEYWKDRPVLFRIPRRVHVVRAVLWLVLVLV